MPRRTRLCECLRRLSKRLIDTLIQAWSLNFPGENRDAIIRDKRRVVGPEFLCGSSRESVWLVPSFCVVRPEKVCGWSRVFRMTNGFCKTLFLCFHEKEVI